MTRILVLGGEGMLGHKVFQGLAARLPRTFCTVRGGPEKEPVGRVGILQGDTVIPDVDATDLASLDGLVTALQPSAIVNCIGVVKQRPEARDAVSSITLNSLLPHRLAAAAETVGARVIHFSTDCVFSGRTGGYTEDDVSDAEDLYGRSKFLGEVAGPNALTLRTSIVGRELYNFASLLEWFLAQKGKAIKGFRRVLYSGVTTNVMARLVGDLIEHHPTLTGLYQVAGPWISKHDLLCLARDAFRLDVDIVPDDAEVNDRTLVGDRFRAATGFVAPSWEEMLAEVAADPTPYQSWRA